MIILYTVHYTDLPQGGWGRRMHSESLKKHLEQKCIQWFHTNALILNKYIKTADIAEMSIFIYKRFM